MVVEILDSLDDLPGVVDDGWLVVLERTPLLSEELRQTACEVRDADNLFVDVKEVTSCLSV